MARSRNLLIILLGILAGGVVGFVAYHRSQVQPSPFEENTAYFEARYPAIAMAGKDIETAIAAYKAEHGSFPASFEALHLTNFPSGVSASYVAYFEYSRPGGDSYMLSVRMGTIGVRLATRGDFRRIEAVLPDSPASKANLMPGDYVLEIDGKDATHVSYSDFIAAIQGVPGTSVTLTLRKDKVGTTGTVTLTRQPSIVPISFKPR